MNRALRRAKPRQKKMNRSGMMQVPNWFDKFQKFDDIERIFQKLIHGEIEFNTETNRPTITSSRGIVYDVCDEIEDWIVLWRRVAEKYEKHYNDEGLVTVNNRLLNGLALSHFDIVKGISVVNRQKEIFDELGQKTVGEVAKDLQIKKLMTGER